MILLDRCRVVVTMDDAGTELDNASVLIDGGVIRWVGQGRPPLRERPEVLDGRGLVALPGLINTHHHLYQTLTRVHAQQGGLFDWLRELYPIWAMIDVDWERAAAEAGLAELALSGCATTTDHHYVFPAGSASLLEAEIEVAAKMGLRFHPCRGSMDLGESTGWSRTSTPSSRPPTTRSSASTILPRGRCCGLRSAPARPSRSPSD